MEPLSDVVAASLRASNSNTNGNLLKLKEKKETPDPVTCPTCGDTMKYGDAPSVVGPLFFYYREKCQCEKQRAAQIEREQYQRRQLALWDASMLTGELREKRLHTLLPMLGTELALVVARSYVDEWPSRRGLIFTGGVGCGKTHLVCGIAAALLEQSVSVLYVNWPEYARRMKDSWGHDGSTFARFDPTDWRLLILDDLAQEHEPLSTAMEAELLAIVEARELRSLPTLATTNVTKAEFVVRVGARVADRLLGRCEWVANTAASYRTRSR